jgi:predicted RNA-binding Zn-ribbon protein involved in translation (DUF1610 family)
MPIILPPDDMTTFPQEELKKPEKLFTWEEHRRIQLYMNVPPWKCPKCGVVYHGRVKICRIIYSSGNPPPCNEPRPADYNIGDPTKPGNDFNPWKVR